LRRLLGLLLTLWAVVTLTFIALYLVPGDPAQVLLSESNASAAEIAERRDELGLNDSLAVQYGRYLCRLLQGDLGRSFFTGRPVTATILEQLPATFTLALAAMVVAVTTGLGLGLLAAVRPGSWLDIVVTGLATMGISTPVFWSGLLAIWLFALVLGWLPATGQGGLEFLILPASVLGFSAAGAVARLTRASVLDVVDKPYIHVARSKGLPPRPLLLRHTLRVALLPIITVIGLQFGFLLGGTVVTETIFARQGLGRLVVSAILRKDYPIVLGVVLVGVVGYVTVNFVTDLLYGALDPRIRKRLR
jgi:peptide/nickel transport system permease protein/oligopeptide transport system permease protein